MPDTFRIWGHIVEESEPEDLARELKKEDQIVVYESTDEMEARAIMNAGGYLVDGVWRVAERGERIKEEQSA